VQLRDISSLAWQVILCLKAAQGDAPRALKAHQQSLQIREALAAAEPSSALAKRDLMVSISKLWYVATD